MKNVGSEKLVSDAVTKRLSAVEPLLRDAKIPSSMPMTMETIVESPTSTRVFTSLPDETSSFVICWLS